MATIRQEIISSLQNELSFIKPANGYETLIKDVFVGYKHLNSVLTYPSLAFSMGTDILKTPLDDAHIREIDIVVSGYLSSNTEAEQDGNLTTQIEKLYSDLYKFFYRYTDIASDKTSSLIQIPGIIEYDIIEKQSFIETNQNKCVTGILLKLQYLEDPKSIHSNISALSNTVQV